MKSLARILVVDDDPRICRAVSRYIEAAGYSVRHCGSSTIASELLKSFQPDLVLLDLNLPDGHGLEIAKAIRSYSQMGIIIISGTIEQVDKIISLELGADDFLNKPLNLRELVARIRSVLRRTQNNEEMMSQKELVTGGRILSFNGWTLDLDTHGLQAPDGTQMHLTSHEFRFLSLLASNANKVMSRQQILEYLGSKEWSPIDRSIDVMIGKLRRKLGSCGDSFNPILTIRGEGYKFVNKENDGRGGIPPRNNSQPATAPG